MRYNGLRRGVMWTCCVILALSVLPAVAELVDPAHEASISVFYNLEDGVSAEGAVVRFYRVMTLRRRFEA